MNASRSVWVEVDLDALIHNYHVLSAHMGPVPLFPVVKANAYGLGDAAAGALYEALGAPLLCVTRTEEGVRLRASGVRTDLLLLAPFAPGQAEQVVAHGLLASVSQLWQAEELSRAALARGTRARVHLKVETGLGRSGFARGGFQAALRTLRALPGLQIEGIFSHLAAATDRRYTDRQRDAFEEFSAQLGDGQAVRHLANSAAILARDDLAYDGVRPGTLLYGQHPPGTTARLDLADPFCLKARVLSVHELEAGSSIGYGLDETSRAHERFCLIGAGWADGLTLAPQRLRPGLARGVRAALKDLLRGVRGAQVYATIHGRRYPFAGRIAMQTALLRVDQSVRVGDTATLPAMRLCTDARLARVYRLGGREVAPGDLREALARTMKEKADHE